MAGEIARPRLATPVERARRHRRSLVDRHIRADGCRVHLARPREHRARAGLAGRHPVQNSGGGVEIHPHHGARQRGLVARRTFRRMMRGGEMEHAVGRDRRQRLGQRGPVADVAHQAFDAGFEGACRVAYQPDHAPAIHHEKPRQKPAVLPAGPGDQRDVHASPSAAARSPPGNISASASAVRARNSRSSARWNRMLPCECPAAHFGNSPALAPTHQ
jgi:hypothetical protein